MNNIAMDATLGHCLRAWHALQNQHLQHLRDCTICKFSRDEHPDWGGCLHHDYDDDTPDVVHDVPYTEVPCRVGLDMCEAMKDAWDAVTLGLGGDVDVGR